MIDIKKAIFFDRQVVIDKLSKAKRKVLSKFGAFVRQSAKSSIKTRKKVATPGNPPSSHTGLLKKLIFFGYDTDNESVVVGPKYRNGKPPVPKTLESGGSAKHWRTGKQSIWRAFPYMTPALKKESPKFPGLFSNVVK